MMIDWDRVRELKGEIGDDDFAEVAAMFLEESDEVIARLSGDRGAALLEQDLHFLKGAALNFGFSQLAILCQDGERLAATGLADIALDPVRAAYALSRKAFVEDLGEIAA